jgi:hypothetical protein
MWIVSYVFIMLMCPTIVGIIEVLLCILGMWRCVDLLWLINQEVLCGF